MGNAEPPPPRADTLTDAEKEELKATVLTQLRRAISGDVLGEDAEMLADYISDLVNQQKSQAEITAELAFFDKEADPFVSWVADRKDQILAKRGKRPALKALLTPNPVTTSLEDVATSSANASRTAQHPGPSGTDNQFVVVTDRLVLQPNNLQLTEMHEMEMGYDENEDDEGHAQPMSETDKKKMELAEKWTKNLQTIMEKLADKTLDDLRREKYQSMAQAIQAKLTEISERPRGPWARAEVTPPE